MKLTVYLPSGVLLEADQVAKIKAEGWAGEFTLMPRHIDMAAALAPGLLAFYPEAGGERLVAVDEGVLTKIGPEVSVAVRQAVIGELGELERQLERILTERDELDKATRTAVARLEADFVRRFTEFGKL